MTEATTKPRAATKLGALCCADTWPAGSWHGSTCRAKAKHEHEGRAYCARHYPPFVQAKHAEKVAEYEQQRAARKAREQAAEDMGKDAERYRKLIATGNFRPSITGSGWGLSMGGPDSAKSELDAAADALPEGKA